jgi:hypothetical protein
MKTFKYFFFFFCLISFINISAQDKPTVNFEELILAAEINMQMVVDARKLTEIYDIPHTIYLPEGIFIEAKGVENNRVVYTIINDMHNQFNNGETAFWEEVSTRFNLSVARIHWVNRPTQNPTLGYDMSDLSDGESGLTPSFVMVLESTNDAVMTFNYNDGSLINAAFIPGGNPNLSTPIEPLLTPSATILVSDQLTDNIVEFDTMGTFVRVLFGSNTAVLDNCRGIELRPPNTTVVAAVAGGANQDAIAEFDLVTGNYIGNFIAPNATQMDGPWDIVFRASDCLVAGQASNDIVRYDLSGNYIGSFVPSISFPEQIVETIGGNIIAAGFSTPSGLYIYDSNGNQLNYFSAVTGLRGVFQLGNGNYLVTSGTGVYVLDQFTGAVVATPVSGVAGRSTHEYDLSIVPVELTSFTGVFIDQKVVLNWTTATEINNQGFEIERSEDKFSFNSIGFVPGFGTTSEPKSYSYTDQTINSGIYYYRLKQIDYDGSFTYSGIVEVEVPQPTGFSLMQNYPNPFNPSTTIKFTIPEKEFVSLKVYDVMGNEVAILLNEEKQAGLHSIQFEASKLSSGTYFYKLQVGNIVEMKKMILLK